MIIITISSLLYCACGQTIGPSTIPIWGSGSSTIAFRFYKQKKGGENNQQTKIRMSSIYIYQVFA